MVRVKVRVRVRVWVRVSVEGRPCSVCSGP